MDSIAEIIYNKLEPQVKSFCSKKYENMKQIFSAQMAPKKSKLAGRERERGREGKVVRGDA